MATLKDSRRGFMVGATMAGTSLLVGCTLGDIVGAGAHTGTLRGNQLAFAAGTARRARHPT